MQNTLARFLGTLECHEPQIAGNVAIVQLGGTDPNFPPVTPYHAAHPKGLVGITETGGADAVSRIRAQNFSDGLVLILEGEVLVGAKQNRTVNTSVLLPPRSVTIIPVNCVERQRWTGETDAFTPSDNFVTPDIRAGMIRSGLEYMDAGGGYRPDQGGIWNDVADRMAFMNIRSATENFTDLQGAKNEKLHDLASGFPRRPGAVGIVGFIGGRVVGCDIVPEPGIFAGYYDRLVKSYVLDSMFLKMPGVPEAGYTALAERFLVKAGSSNADRRPSPGVGATLRLTGPAVKGSALVHEGSMIHLGAFAETRRRSL